MAVEIIMHRQIVTQGAIILRYQINPHIMPVFFNLEFISAEDVCFWVDIYELYVLLDEMAKLFVAADYYDSNGRYILTIIFLGDNELFDDIIITLLLKLVAHRFLILKTLV